MTTKVEAIWDDGKSQGWRYKLPGVAGFVTPARKSTSIISSNAALAREVQEVAFAVGVKLPPTWDLMVKR